MDSDLSDSGDDVESGADVLDLKHLWDVKLAWADARAEAGSDPCDLPRAVAEPGNVTVFYDAHLEVKRLACQSVIRLGKPSESYSMYCYLHKCKIYKKPD